MRLRNIDWIPLLIFKDLWVINIYKFVMISHDFFACCSSGEYSGNNILISQKPTMHTNTLYYKIYMFAYKENANKAMLIKHDGLLYDSPQMTYPYKTDQYDVSFFPFFFSRFSKIYSQTEWLISTCSIIT